jgi:hypothetical protein
MRRRQRVLSRLRRRPSLASIHVAMNWLAVENLTYPWNSLRLLYADFASSRIRHVTELAAFLSVIMPELQVAGGRSVGEILLNGL